MTTSTASESTLIVEPQHDGRILLVSFNRPNAANAINPAMGDDLLRLASQLENAPEVEAVIFTGKGRLFSGGGDVGSFREALESGGDTSPAFTALLRELTVSIHGAISRMVAAGPLLVAAANGPVAGAALGLVCACDYAFARPGATLRAGFSKLGLTPDTGSTYYLPRIVGYRKALDILITGDAVDAQAALSLGIYSALIDADSPEFVDQVVARTAQLIAPGRTVRETRRLLRASEYNSMQEQLDLERTSMVAVSQDAGVVGQVRKAIGIN
jgi:2-(1,2-epoxy-1,2-dihydrophenyl)acetyl-CoA isomerase